MGNFVVASAPGRVNLIGEHTDYHMGFVMPASINLRTKVYAKKRNDKRVKIYSKNLGKYFETELKKDMNMPVWVKYILGFSNFFDLGGMEIEVESSVPIGAGLSSSAALEVASILAFSYLFNIKLSPHDIVKYAKRVENEVVGVPCGIMDQFAAVFGKKGKAIFLDCKTLDFEYIPFPEDWSIVVFDTGIKHSLYGGEYKKRQEECNKILSILGKNLREIEISELSKINGFEKEKLRCEFVIEENERVIKSKRAFQEKNKEEISNLFLQSHSGLKNKYEVSIKELDLLCDISYKVGFIGARMTGAGFGGSIIAICERGKEKELAQKVKEEYSKITQKNLSSYFIEIDDGAKIEETQTKKQKENKIKKFDE